MKSLFRLFAPIAAMFFAAHASAAPVPPYYGVQVLSDIGGQPLFPSALNNNLQVSTYYAFDHPVPAFSEDNFVDFNDRAETLGWSYRYCCEYVTRYFYLDRGGERLWLDGLREANAINDQSIIAGSVNTAGGVQRAVLFDGTQYQDIGTLGGASSSAMDVNNSGDVIGWSETADGEIHPFLFSDGTMHDLGAQPGDLIAGAINDSGQMVLQYRDAAFIQHILFYSDGVWQEIHSGGSEVFFVDLNNLGQVLLHGSGPTRGERSLLWQDGVLYTLLSLVDPSAHYTYDSAVDMNDHGQVVVRGCSPTEYEHCYILMLQPVPEPSRLALLIAGLGLFALARLRGRLRT